MSRIALSFSIVGLASDTAGAAGVTYRNGVVIAVDAQGRKLEVLLGDQVRLLRMAEDVSAATLRPGDPAMLGIREGDGGPIVVHLRPAAGPAPVSTTVTPSGEPVRRPMRVVPNPRPAGEAPDDFAGLGTGKQAAAWVVEPAPEPPAMAAPEPSAAVSVSFETRVAEGRRDLEASLDAVDILAREADRLWLQYVKVCPAPSGADTRGWLSLRTESVPAPPCAHLYERVANAAVLVRRHLDDAEERARAGAVPPGTIRDVLRRYDLER